MDENATGVPSFGMSLIAIVPWHVVAVGPGAMRERCSTVFSGCYAPALLGTICPTAILVIKPAIAAFSGGSAMAR